MKLQLIKPSLEDKQQLLEFKNTLIKDNSFFQGTSNLKEYDQIEDWLEYLKNQESYETCVKGLVPNIVYMLVDENNPEDIIGMCDIRLDLNEYLNNFGGNIGYIINPKFRGLGYGNEILRLCLEKCIELNMNRVLITCVDFNIASEKVIRHNGGVLEDIRREPNQNVNLMRFFIELDNSK